MSEGIAFGCGYGSVYVILKGARPLNVLSQIATSSDAHLSHGRHLAPRLTAPSGRGLLNDDALALSAGLNRCTALSKARNAQFKFDA